MKCTSIKRNLLYIYIPIIVFLSVITIPAKANTPDSKVAVQTVEQTLINLLDVLKTMELSSDPKKAQEEVYKILDDNLATVVDFKSIVKRIMGKHFKAASKEQRNRFLHIFKKSLVASYGKFMVSGDIKSLANSIEYSVSPEPISKKKNRAQVSVVFKISNKPYEAIYSMKYNPKNDKWALENLVVEGINLGINYRNQFDRMMGRNNNDINKVIEEWSGADQSRLEEGEG